MQKAGERWLCRAAWAVPGTSILLLGSSEQRETASPAHLYSRGRQLAPPTHTPVGGGELALLCSTPGNLLKEVI